MTDSSTWPLYQTAPGKHVHALGVVSVNYNALEFHLLLLIVFYLGGKWKRATTIFDNATNNVRLDVLRALANHPQHPANVRELLFYFTSGYAICAANRNILMHSHVISRRKNDPPEMLRLIKRTRKSGKENQFEFDLDDIRRVADEIRAYVSFASGIVSAQLRWQNPNAPWPPTLPEKPPLPCMLTIPSR